MERPTTDLVSPELREAEREIDSSHLSNRLMAKPFAEAAWYFLASCEEHLVAPMINPSLLAAPPDRYALGSQADSIITHAKWPLIWLRKTCDAGGQVPTRSREDMYLAACELSELSDDYLAFEAAYTYASIGAVKLNLDGTTIVPDPVLRDNLRYEAYDRLVDGGGDLPELDDLAELAHEIERTVRIKGERFAYKLNPSMVKIAATAITLPLGPDPALPATWQFSRYTVEDFQHWARVLRSLCVIHLLARVAAVGMGLPGFGYVDSLIVMDRSEMVGRLRRYTGLSERTVAALLEDFTYGSRGVNFPDPVLQPVIPLLPDRYAIAPSLVLNSSLERNFVVLMNRIPEERAIYNGLSGEREDLSRSRIINAIAPMSIRHWHGNVPGWSGASEVDLALMDEFNRDCLILELKSFVAPAEVREVWERSKEIAVGIRQVRARQQLALSKPEGLHRVLGIDQTWNIGWAVASESSVGGVYVQAEDVPVVRIPHLIRKMVRNGGLRHIDRWLHMRGHLPAEGRHYEVVDVKPEIGGWSVEWYNLRILIDDTYT